MPFAETPDQSVCSPAPPSEAAAAPIRATCPPTLTGFSAATHLGIPVSTTHNISAAIMGVGAARRLNAIKWTVVQSMVWAWLLTIPVTALVAYGLVWLLGAAGIISPSR